MAADDAESACPVDHKTRDAWLSHARATEAASRPSDAPKCPVDHAHPPQKASNSWTQTLSSYLWSSPSTATTTTAATEAPRPPHPTTYELGTARVTSTIPRALAPTDPTAACPVEHGASANPPANAELESGHDAATGHWVYPSEKMFFDAMRRKGYDPRETDMRSVVPIHNAVNERAWAQIREWEAPYLAAAAAAASPECAEQGPRLASFANKSDRMTPTARINTILGYTAPFDRHDWVIDRCGTRVDYVIDFYAGRPGGPGAVAGPSFYLDVRPKLNTWEGVKMRVMRWTGMA